jgi:glutathione transport system permease protein
VRGNTLVLKQQTFIESARSIGASDATILFNHICRNGIIDRGLFYHAYWRVDYLCCQPVISGAWRAAADAGVGAMLNEARADMVMAPHVAIFPAVAIFLTVLAFNLLGDGLRDALDPRIKGINCAGRIRNA